MIHARMIHRESWSRNTAKLIIFHPCDYSSSKLRMCTQSQSQIPKGNLDGAIKRHKQK